MFGGSPWSKMSPVWSSTTGRGWCCRAAVGERPEDLQAKDAGHTDVLLLHQHLASDLNRYLTLAFTVSPQTSERFSHGQEQEKGFFVCFPSSSFVDLKMSSTERSRHQRWRTTLNICNHQAEYYLRLFIRTSQKSPTITDSLAFASALIRKQTNSLLPSIHSLSCSFN